MVPEITNDKWIKKHWVAHWQISSMNIPKRTLTHLEAFKQLGFSNDEALKLAEWSETKYNQNDDKKCRYCGVCGTHVNLRGGKECAGCGAPRE